MGQEYNVICDVETDDQELLKEFMDYIETKQIEHNITEIEKNTFIFYHYRGVDYTFIKDKLKELHKRKPDATFIFSSVVVAYIDELGFQYDFEYDEVEE